MNSHNQAGHFLAVVTLGKDVVHHVGTGDQVIQDIVHIFDYDQ